MTTPGEVDSKKVRIARAVHTLRSGGLVAFPTETVYGLGADATNERAVRQIFEVKGRPADHPLIVHLPSAEQLESWAHEVPEAAYRLAERFWPGPLTLILRRRAGVLDVVTGAQETVGVRVPGHQLALELLAAFGGGLAAPSANRFGRISPTTAAHVRAELGGRVDLILDGGPCGVGLESTILDLSALGRRGGQPRLLRPGAVSAEMLREILGREVERGSSKDGALPRVSGSLASHYAPATPAVLVADALAYVQAYMRACGVERSEVACAVLARRPQPAEAPLPRGLWRTLPDEPDGYGRHLYAALRELDAAGCGRIVVEAPPQTPAWAAVADRLRRATTP